MNRRPWFLLLIAIGCSETKPPPDMVAAAKDVIRSHEAFASDSGTYRRSSGGQDPRHQDFLISQGQLGYPRASPKTAISM